MLRVQAEMDEIRDGMLTHEGVQKVRERSFGCWSTVMFALLVLAVVIEVVYFHITMRVPVEGDIIVGARIYHYDPWRHKDYMAMEVTAVNEDGTVELSGVGLTGWMAGSARVPMSDLTDGHRRRFRVEWMTR